MEEAKRRDHRKLGRELGLFMMTEEGPGFPFFLPKGMVLKNTLDRLLAGDATSATAMWRSPPPSSSTESCGNRSGHWDHYKDNMYTTMIDEEDFAVKPMNCPGGMLVYTNPSPTPTAICRCAWANWAWCTGMSCPAPSTACMRVRCFTQDDAHIFMTRDQMKDEIKGVVRLFDEVYIHLWLEVPCRAFHHAGRPHGQR